MKVNSQSIMSDPMLNDEIYKTINLKMTKNEPSQYELTR